MHRGHRMTVLLLLSLLLGAGGLTACATPHGGHKAKLTSKKRPASTDRGYGIYDPSALNQKILRRGQKVMGSNALGSY